MKRRLLFTGLFIAVLCCTKSNVHSQDLQNEVNTHFRTESRTIDSLKSAFLCDSISFHKWDEEYAGITDSTFSVIFINSKKLPPSGLKQAIPIFKRISQSIKSSLKYPEKYNSYQIVFLKVDDDFGFGKIASPTLQMVVREDNLYEIDEY